LSIVKGQLILDRENCTHETTLLEPMIEQSSKIQLGEIGKHHPPN